MSAGVFVHWYCLEVVPTVLYLSIASYLYSMQKNTNKKANQFFFNFQKRKLCSLSICLFRKVDFTIRSLGATVRILQQVKTNYGGYTALSQIKRSASCAMFAVYNFIWSLFLLLSVLRNVSVVPEISFRNEVGEGLAWFQEDMQSILTWFPFSNISLQKWIFAVECFLIQHRIERWIMPTF